MSRLRYPFTEIQARCRLCGAIGFTASSEHALGGRLIDWRRQHARVCPEWRQWAEAKGLRLDPNGALLYPKEEGTYTPLVRPKSGLPEDGAAASEPEGPEFDLMEVPAEDLAQDTLF